MITEGVYKYKIAQRDIDFTCRPTLSSVSDYVLSAAGQDADRNGFGIRTLSENNWMWVLSRFCIEFERYPAQYEDFVVRTWVSEVNRLMTTRNFTITSASGERIGAAVSNWAMLDMNTRKAVDLSANLEYAHALIPEPSPAELPLRIGSIKASRQEERRVAYGDIDFNRHTNSLRYLGMMMDMLEPEHFENHTVRRMDMNFIHESGYGDTLTVAMQDGVQGETLFEINNCGQTVCRGRAEWQKLI